MDYSLSKGGRDMTNNMNVVREEIKELSQLCVKNSNIDPNLYNKYDIKRGLRDLDGKGVLTGITEISEIIVKKNVGGVLMPCDGRLYYRGINVEDLVRGHGLENRFGFEETAYLLIFGELPTQEQLLNFTKLLSDLRTLPKYFVRDIIMKSPSSDMMNALSRSVLTLYAYDENANDTSIPNVLRQQLRMISLFPLFAVYGYNAYNHYHKGGSLYIHDPRPDLSTAENILYMLRPDKEYSALEAQILDIALMLHAEHGGGNNSTFTIRVVSSSGTDSYSAVCAALGSLKGPRHGGANIKVVQMFEDIKSKISDWKDEDEIKNYLSRILDKQEFDRTGLIYGMGHAVYSLSDPRARVFKRFVQGLAREKGKESEFELYSAVERLAAEVIASKRKIFKGVSANVDFYSGFVYDMLGLPPELYTPIFAVARIAGWSAHRLEELIGNGKIIRPAYMAVSNHRPYVDIKDRK